MGEAEALLGHGITVSPADGGLAVESRSLALPWHPGHGRAPGTAVEWDSRLYEVTEVRRAQGGERWALRTWPEGEVIRHAARLDAAAIEALVAARADEDRRAERHAALQLALPFVGLMPAEFQRRWEREYNLPALRATLASAVMELAFAALVPLQAVSMVFNEPLLPARWRWIAAVALVAGIDAFVRLVHMHTMREPIGSVFTSPLLLLTRRAEPGPAVPPAPAAPGPGALRTVGGETLRLTLFAFAPGALQAEWAAQQRLPLLAPTYATAALEALGGALNLVRERQGDVLLVLVDLFLIGEGLLRAGLAAATREPVGSVLGLPWRRRYRRWLDEAGGAPPPADAPAGPATRP
ncbi:MAG TPA: hypothetical protein VLW17_10675 [Thermoanaerobaculaceae bacterium]|nr:hypothetical protein [Thermoanaerobaculaceae bacterium]